MLLLLLPVEETLAENWQLEQFGGGTCTAKYGCNGTSAGLGKLSSRPEFNSRQTLPEKSIGASSRAEAAVPTRYTRSLTGDTLLDRLQAATTHLVNNLLRLS